MGLPSASVAGRVLDAIEPDGNIAQLAVPVDLLDPPAVRFWVRSILGDHDLADELLMTHAAGIRTLLAARRAQCASVMPGGW